MKRYIGTVCVTYYQEVTVHANNTAGARLALVEQFDLTKAECGPYEVYDIEEVTGEQNADDR